MIQVSSSKCIQRCHSHQPDPASQSVDTQVIIAPRNAESGVQAHIDLPHWQRVHRVNICIYASKALVLCSLLEVRQDERQLLPGLGRLQLAVSEAAHVVQALSTLTSARVTQENFMLPLMSVSSLPSATRSCTSCRIPAAIARACPALVCRVLTTSSTVTGASPVLHAS